MSWQEVVLIIVGSALGLYLLGFVLVLGVIRKITKSFDKSFDNFGKW